MSKQANTRPSRQASTQATKLSSIRQASKQANQQPKNQCTKRNHTSEQPSKRTRVHSRL
jgi:hypothetical protein